jgi:hypothetical protein
MLISIRLDALNELENLIIQKLNKMFLIDSMME